MARVKLARDIFGRAYVKEATYKLVFTEPGSSDGKFRLLPAESKACTRAWTPIATAS